MKKEDLFLRKILKGAAVYYGHTPEQQARIAKVSHATWYRRLQNPDSFTLGEIRRLVKYYRIGPDDIFDFLGIREGQ